MENKMFTNSEKNIIDQGIRLLESKFKRYDFMATDHIRTKEYCRLKIGSYEYEVFMVLFLDNKHKLIQPNMMFRGSISEASVYPREIVREAMKLNSISVCLAHNHPAGECEPSSNDKAITIKIVNALELIDTRVLDHIIVSNTNAYSFAEAGLI